ncbi:MAG: hypothetical protein JWP22_2767, partial [Ramlibacter sp.]|nr:hypothetical protein [Ramlibacter sp.]
LLREVPRVRGREVLLSGAMQRG